MIAQRNSLRRRTLGSLGAVVLLMVALAPAAAAKSELPFVGRLEGHVIPAQPRCGPNVTLAIATTGVATQLGRWSAESSNCSDPGFAVGGAAIWDGVITIVAADGSTIFATYEGVQQAPLSGVAQFDLTQTVVSGTGRFARATGTWTVTGALDFSTLTLRGTIDGSIAR